MTGKWMLYAGLIILTIGVVFRILTENTWWPLSIIIAGIFLKVCYISGSIGKRNYKPGYEFLLLVTGLILFFFGVFLTYTGQSIFISPTVLKVSGISLKVIFLYLFLKKTRKNQV